MAGREAGLIVTEGTILVSGLVATAVARKLVDVVWVAASGKAAPADPSDPRISTGEAIAFAMLTGALGGMVRLIAQRQANAIKAWRLRGKAGAAA